MDTLDLLVFGPHPDDAELGLGGTIALHTQKGYKVGICDLTMGEMGTNGTTEERQIESREAAKTLGVTVRENLAIPDGFVSKSEENLKKTIEVIRKYRPNKICTVNFNDDHPDHANGTLLIKEATFLSGLYKYPAEGQRFRPENLFYYFAARPKNPDIVVDITLVYDIKLRAIMKHESQLGLNKEKESIKTNLTNPNFLEKIKARDKYMGSFIKADYGEGLICDRIPRVNDLIKFGG
ncbi:bacillithiol biosynthesis deacetylase BshB1 [Natranaerobius trueperi]|uniref:Bacillithiol biosynthesis deacetylase BshB1 n=1 Tax=Natranaerobius trueperi TaxID=759412 RepID=A0A226BZQ1_9FIRM|nr:bacillithiol biosynthesis deacetylase BshB1 [Natranaerobius trueperi]OWZ83600.1 bacillithiol biosynthesis deacetylase BshB1 [Natranaerobius trueperi]